MLTAQNKILRRPAIKQKFMYFGSDLDAFINDGFNITPNGARQIKPMLKIDKEANIFEYTILSEFQN